MMAAALYIAGTITFVAGLAAIAFGTPSSALDFGNTLIVAGTTSAVGGLIVIGLGAVVSRLQRIADNIGVANAVEHIERPTPVPPQRPEPRVEPKPFEPRGPSTPPEFPPFMARKPSDLARAEPEPAPSLEPAMSDASADGSEPEPPPKEKPSAPKDKASEPEAEALGPDMIATEPQPAAELPPKSFFESVWPQEKSLSPKPEVAPKPPESPLPRPLPTPLRREPEKRDEKPRAVAVLKSGVVDGMGYTLYVDGSIEAELPEGTVRFASIHELRAHLEKSG
jgi:hypothetical protein